MHDTDDCRETYRPRRLLGRDRSRIGPNSLKVHVLIDLPRLLADTAV
jgi:hypothetical protein